MDMEEDFDDYLEIEADATDFTMNESYCIATNSVFSRLDFSNVDDQKAIWNGRHPKLLSGFFGLMKSWKLHSVPVPCFFA